MLIENSGNRPWPSNLAPLFHWITNRCSRTGAYLAIIERDDDDCIEFLVNIPNKRSPYLLKFSKKVFLSDVDRAFRDAEAHVDSVLISAGLGQTGRYDENYHHEYNTEGGVGDESATRIDE